MPATIDKPGSEIAPAPRTVGLRVSAVVETIPGAVSALLGGMILLGGDDQHIGLGGDLPWRVGDISQWWGIGLLAVAAAFLLGAVALRRHRPAGGGSAAWSDLLVHGVVFWSTPSCGRRTSPSEVARTTPTG